MMDALDGVMAVMEAAFDPQFGEAWTRRQVSDALVVPQTSLILAGQDGAAPLGGHDVAGFVLSRGAAGEEELLLIAVRPEFQGRGIGRQLMTRFLHDASDRGTERVFLEMRDGNCARALYLASGFRQVGRRPGYYRRGTAGSIDALTFARSID